MKLIDLLVKELPKRCGFPKGANECVQDVDGTIKFFDSGDLCFDGWYGWCGSPRGGFYCTKEDKIMGLDLSCDHSSAIITRAKYESALAKNDGWIEWGGGECPVEKGTLVDIRIRNGKESHGVRANESTNGVTPDASYAFWRKDENGGDIIAYRLHRDINSRSNDDRLEQDLNEFIGQDGDAPCSDAPFPPEGIEIEYSTHGQEAWYRGIVTACGESMCIVKNLSGAEQAFHKFDIEFRPLRTEAEKARETIIKEIDIACKECPHSEALAEHIYESIAAGKITRIKLEKK